MFYVLPLRSHPPLIQFLCIQVGDIPLLFGCQQDPSPDPIFYENQRETIDESTAWATTLLGIFANLSLVFNFRDAPNHTENSAIGLIQQLMF